MWINRLIFAGSTSLKLLAAPALLVAPALLASPALPAQAKNSNVQKNDDKQPAPSSCKAYQQAADGSWIELPCQAGPASQAPTQRKSATKVPDEETR
jgi:hypothetical protein